MKYITVRLTLIFFSFIILCMFTGKSDAEIDRNSIVAVWLFDEGAGDVAKDSSGNGHDGTIKGGVKWVDGKFDDALDFPGNADSYVYVSYKDDLSLNTFTVTAWVKLFPEAEKTHTIVCKVPEVADPAVDFRNYMILVTPEDWGDATKGWLFQCRFPDGLKYAQSKPTVQDGKWYHIAGTYDMEAIRAYTDGVLQGELAATAKPFVGPNPVFIGGRPPTDPDPTVGIIDEVGIFNEALSEDDIKTIMTKGLRQVSAVSKKGKLATVWGKIKGDL